MIHLIAFIASLLAGFATNAQSKWVFEQYNYIEQSSASLVPMVHFEAKNNWYAELRYNYEDLQTISIFGGKTFSGGNSLEYALTPMAGYSAGNFTGVSFGINTELEWDKFYLSAQSQYSMATQKKASSFFFNWSELGYSITNHLFSGVAMQYTKAKDLNQFEPGFLAGLSFKNISFPFYVFSPFAPGRYFILGLNYEYNLKKKNSNRTL